MGLFSDGEKFLGSYTNRVPFFDGNGECIFSLVSAVSKVNRSNKKQTVLTCRVLAASPGADVEVGKDYAYRWEADGRYPESDKATYLGFILGLAGIAYDPKNLVPLIEGLNLDVAKYDLNTDRGVGIAKLDIDDAIEKLREDMESGEGTAWANRVAMVRLLTKMQGGYTKTFASGVPATMHSGGNLTDQGQDLLSRQGWSFSSN